VSLKKPTDWQALTELTRGQAFVVERVRLARLSADDQVFVAAFLRSHGSIKEMEQVFGVSYPTVKARLGRIADALEFVELDPKPARSEVLERLGRGEITAEDAIRQLQESR
jgi:hypothetical protein